MLDGSSLVQDPGDLTGLNLNHRYTKTPVTIDAIIHLCDIILIFLDFPLTHGPEV
jgi:hypothetical protein